MSGCRELERSGTFKNKQAFDSPRGSLLFALDRTLRMPLNLAVCNVRRLLRTAATTAAQLLKADVRDTQVV